MDIHGIVFLKLLTILFKVHLKAADIQYILNRTDWIEAHEGCITLGGKLATKDNISECRDQIQHVQNKAIWTGGHDILSPWLANKGCLDLDLANVSRHLVQNKSIQHCFQLCGKPYFGYKNRKCFCIVKLDTTLNFTSNSRCTQLYNGGNVTVWIYKREELTINGADNLKYSGNCVGARCENESTIHEVSNCRSLRRPYCQNTNDSMNWNEAEDYCIRNSISVMTNYESLCRNKKTSSLFWTGYKRYWLNTSHAIEESIHHLSEVSNCSYTQCSNNEDTAMSKQGNCSEELDGYACLLNRVTKTMSKVSVGSTTKVSSQSFNNVSIMSTNKQQQLGNSFQSTLNGTPYQLTTNSDTNQTTRDHSTETTTLDCTTSGILKESAKEISFTVLIVVLTIAAVAFIIGVAVLVSFRLRRQGPFKRKGLKTDTQMMGMHDPNYHDFNTTPNNGPSILHGNTAYDKHYITSFGNSDQTSSNKQSALNDQYSIVMKPIPETTESSFNQTEESSFDIKENEYDRLNDIKDRGRNDSNNIYDSNSGLRDEDDPTYNTTSHMHVRSRDGSNNIYDSTSRLSDEYDPTYNTTS